MANPELVEKEFSLNCSYPPRYVLHPLLPAIILELKLSVIGYVVSIGCAGVPGLYDSSVACHIVLFRDVNVTRNLLELSAGVPLRLLRPAVTDMSIRSVIIKRFISVSFRVVVCYLFE